MVTPAAAIRIVHATKSSYSFEVTATADTLSASAPVQVQVLELPAPEFVTEKGQEDRISFSFAGNAEALVGTVLGTVVAAIPGDATADIEYSLLPTAPDADEDAALFAIDEDSGVISLKGQFPADGQKYEFSFEVQASAPEYGKTGSMTVRLVMSARVARQQDMLLFPSVDRVIAVAAVDLIGARFDIGAIDAPGVPQVIGDQAASQQLRLLSSEDMWAEWDYDDSVAERKRGIDDVKYMQLRDFVHERGFDFALSGAARGPQARVWGSGSRVSLDRSPIVAGEHFNYKGEVDMLMLGFEARSSSGDGPKMGLAYSTSDAEFKVADGEVTRKLQSVHPYLSYSHKDRGNIWLSFGIGRGDYTRQDETRGATALSAAGGGTTTWDLSGYEIGIGGKVVSGRSVIERTAAFAELEVDAWRAEIEFKLGREFEYPDQELKMRPFVSVDARRDGGGDLSTGAFDAGGGVSLDWAQGLQLQLSGRAQLSEKDVQENRIEGSFSYDYGNDGRGLNLSAQPKFERVENADGSTTFQRTVIGKLGYGLPVRLFKDSGIGQFSLSVSGGGDSREASYGWSFAGRRLDVDLSAAGEKLGLKLKIR